MDIDRYAEWAARIPIGRPPIEAEAAVLSYLCIGLASEAGELAGVVKKLLRDGQWNPEQAADELGDVAYYFARLCAAAKRRQRTHRSQCCAARSSSTRTLRFGCIRPRFDCSSMPWLIRAWALRRRETSA